MKEKRGGGDLTNYKKGFNPTKSYQDHNYKSLIQKQIIVTKELINRHPQIGIKPSRLPNLLPRSLNLSKNHIIPLKPNTPRPPKPSKSSIVSFLTKTP